MCLKKRLLNILLIGFSSLISHSIVHADEEISIAAVSDNFPDGWEFDDAEDGSGLFNWSPTYDDAGVYELEFWLTDGERADIDTTIIVVNNVNLDPIITEPEGDEIEIWAWEEELIEIEFIAEDEDGDDLTWEIEDVDDVLPDGWVFTDNENGTAEFSWEPEIGDYGFYPLMFRVTDENESANEINVILLVEMALPAYFIIEPFGDWGIFSEEGKEGEELEIHFEAESPYGFDDAAWFITDEGDLPDGWEFIDNGDLTADFTWSPGFEDAGEYHPVFLIGDWWDDWREGVVLRGTITIENVNRAPLIVGPNEGEDFDVANREEDVINIVFTAEDPDEDELTWELEDVGNALPDGWEFVDNEDGSAEFTWEPEVGDFGDYQLNFVVSDAGDSSDVIGLILTVNCVLPPFIINEPAVNRGFFGAETNENEEMSIHFEAESPYGYEDAVWELVDDDGLSAGWELADNGDFTADFTWTPDYDDSGVYEPVFAIYNDIEGVAITGNIIVHNVNRTPELVNNLPDAQFDEDTGPWLIAKLDTIIIDPDDEPLEFVGEALNPIEVIVNEQNELIITAPDNFNHINEIPVIILAVDSSGAAISDSFNITIQPVNDIPSQFDLLEPEDGSLISDYPSVTFTREESIDDIEGDDIKYSLLLTYDDADHWYRAIEHNYIDIVREDFIRRSDNPIRSGVVCSRL